MYLEYENERDCLFFLGAGASYGDGVPLQKDIVPEILNTKDEVFEKSEIRISISNFITSNFSFSEEEGIYPSLETLFSYIDYFITNEIAIDDEYTLEKLRSIKEGVIRLIYYITSKSTKSPLSNYEIEKDGRDNDSVYSYFWERSVQSNRNFSVITTNYDNQIDDAFDKWVYAKFGLIDYCIDLLNYTKEDNVKAYDWWVNPREPIPDWSDATPRPIKLIKLHGSLNWKYCYCCGQVTLTPWSKNIDLSEGEHPKFGPNWAGDIEGNNRCPRDNYPLSTMIVPPTHSKTLKHPVVQNLVYEAQKEIRCAKKVVFVGYSLPDADIHIKAVFNKNLRKDVEIIVVNPFLSPELCQAYRGLADNVKFLEKGFMEALDEGLFESVVGKNA